MELEWIDILSVTTISEIMDVLGIQINLRVNERRTKKKEEELNEEGMEWKEGMETDGIEGRDGRNGMEWNGMEWKEGTGNGMEWKKSSDAITLCNRTAAANRFNSLDGKTCKYWSNGSKQQSLGKHKHKL